MDGVSSLLDGFATAITPVNLLYAFIGVLLGTAIGVLPGIGPAMAIALLPSARSSPARSARSAWPCWHRSSSSWPCRWVRPTTSR
jgi:TctA family transporter